MQFLILIILLTNTLAAQQDYTFQSLYRTFEEGKYYYTLPPQTSIYTAPFVTAEKIAQLPIATTIKVEERMDEIAKINGFRTNWYRITFQQNGQFQEGFIWGGHIAVGAFAAKESSDIFFLYGIEKIALVERGNYVEESILLQLNACRDTFLDKLVLEAMGTLYTQTQGNALGNKGLENIQEVIEIAFNDGYCGGVSAGATVFWAGQKLHFVQLLSNGFSNENFTNKYFIYPNDEGGKNQRIILRDEAGEFDVNRQAVYTHRVDLEYVWTKEGLMGF